jgi:hypothetical protein
MASAQTPDRTDVPDEIDLAAARDLRGHAWEIWIRRTFVALIAAVPVLALFNVFGQRASETTVASPVATMSVHAPSTVRGGLLFEARFTITARQPIHNAVLRLSPQWADGLTINTVEPQPSSETSKAGWLALTLGPIDAGATYQLHLEYQVNPTSSGGRTMQVELLDGSQLLTTASRHLQVWP